MCDKVTNIIYHTFSAICGRRQCRYGLDVAVVASAIVAPQLQQISRGLHQLLYHIYTKDPHVSRVIYTSPSMQIFRVGISATPQAGWFAAVLFVLASYVLNPCLDEGAGIEGHNDEEVQIASSVEHNAYGSCNTREESPPPGYSKVDPGLVVGVEVTQQ